MNKAPKKKLLYRIGLPATLGLGLVAGAALSTVTVSARYCEDNLCYFGTGDCDYLEGIEQNCTETGSGVGCFSSSCW